MSLSTSIIATPIYGIWVTPISRKPGSPDHWVISGNTETPWTTTDYKKAEKTIKSLYEYNEDISKNWPISMWNYEVKIYNNTITMIVHSNKVHEDMIDLNF